MRIAATSEAGPLTKAERDRLRRRVRLTLGRFERQLREVRAHIGSSTNRLGGVDVLCRVRARLNDGLLLQAEAIDGEIDGAVDRVAFRLALLAVAALEGRAPRGRP